MIKELDLDIANFFGRVVRTGVHGLPEFVGSSLGNNCNVVFHFLRNEVIAGKLLGFQQPLHFFLIHVFRRSHRFAYRPACPNCNACVPVPLVVERFEASKSLRRIAKSNADLSIRMSPGRATDEQFRLFDRYITSRHGDGEMSGMVEQEYRSMVESSDVDTRLAEFRDPEGRLLAVCLVDWLADGPSAVYSFFEPGESRRSLGTYVILWLIGAAARSNARHVYLGYWIQSSRKMAYKTRFRPLEGLIAGNWQPLSVSASALTTNRLAGSRWC